MVVLTAALDSNRAIDPARGWLSPGSPDLPGTRLTSPWDVISKAGAPAMGTRLPELDDLLGAHYAGGQLHDVVATAVRETLAAKPRLMYKKDALRSLQALDSDQVVGLIGEFQTGRLATEELVACVSDLAKSIPS